MDIEDLCKQITKETGETYDTVKQIVAYVFNFTADVMKDPNDKHDIMFNKLFKFKLKRRFKDEEVAM